MKAALVLVALATTASADAWHGSAGAGGSLLVAGENGGHRTRLDGELDVSYGRYGGLVALRTFDSSHDGIVFAGFVYEAAAARPTLVLDLHADAGYDLDVHAPAAGGGLRTTLAILGPLGVALDTGFYVVIDGVDNTRFVIDANAMVALRW
ncbi:MAG TPA: hypothetical protein VGO00_18880 [Kofleriaceae bacterium]|nr:hypothetical protein [Kofleriaceae bacterium]